MTFFKFKKIKTSKKFGMSLVTAIATKLSLSIKKLLQLSIENAHPLSIFKNLLCDQNNFSKWKILHNWDILRRKQWTAKRSIICYILQRMGWVTRGRLCNLWVTACKVLSNRAYLEKITYFTARKSNISKIIC